MNRSWVRFPPLAPESQPRISGLRGIFIGVDLIKPVLKKSILFCLSLVLAAGVLFVAFSRNDNADSSYPYELSGTTFVKGIGHSIGTFDTGVLKLGQADGKRGLQALNISLKMLDTNVTGTLQYRVFINNKGWQEWTESGTITGLNTMPELITGVQMKLTGTLGENYCVWYSAYTDLHKGIQGWVNDGAVAGSPAESRRIEEIKVMIVKRDRQLGFTGISFRSYMETYNWERRWKGSNFYTGLPGKNKRLEGIEIYLTGTEYTGGIRYRGNFGGAFSWQNWVYDGEMCGRRGTKMEAIEIELTGEVADHYDIYYRTYINGLGWFSWAKNGEASGARDIGRRIEAIQIALVRKNANAPANAFNRVRSTIGYKFVAANSSTGVSEWRIGTPGKSTFASYILKRCRYYNMTEYKDMRCDALVAQVLTDALGSDLGKRSGAKYSRLNEWIGLSALEDLLSSNFTYRDSAGRLIICRPVAKTKLKTLVKKTWNRKEVNITEEDFNTWMKNNCVPGDILVFYNKKKKPIHCAIYSGVQSTSAKEYKYYHGKKKGEKDSDLKPGHYVWHSGYDTGVANKFAFWVAEVGRSYYVRRYRVDSGKNHPTVPR